MDRAGLPNAQRLTLEETYVLLIKSLKCNLLRLLLTLVEELLYICMETRMLINRRLKSNALEYAQLKGASLNMIYQTNHQRRQLLLLI